MSAKSLKHRNVAWISSMILVDVALLFAALAPDLMESALLAPRGVARLCVATFVPPVVLLLSYLVPSDIKAMIVFWRIKNALPGHRAFTQLAPKDPRIDLSRLAKNIGAFPAAPSEQNARWYGLYKQVGNDPAVTDSHRLFLLFRDMATVSLLLLPIVPAAVRGLGFASNIATAAAAVLLVQYVLAAIAARLTGTRFVLNVLALHAAGESVKPRARSKKAASPSAG